VVIQKVLIVSHPVGSNFGCPQLQPGIFQWRGDGGRLEVSWNDFKLQSWTCLHNSNSADCNRLTAVVIIWETCNVKLVDNRITVASDKVWSTYYNPVVAMVRLDRSLQYSAGLIQDGHSLSQLWALYNDSAMGRIPILNYMARYTIINDSQPACRLSTLPGNTCNSPISWCSL